MKETMFREALVSLLEEKKYATLRDILVTLNPADIAGLFAELPERLVMLGRNTLFNKRRAHQPIPVGTPVTYAVGKALNGLAGFLNRTILRRRPMRTDFEVLLAASWHELKEDTRTLTVSVSFGLLLLCVGLFLTCLYLLR